MKSLLAAALAATAVLAAVPAFADDTAVKVAPGTIVLPPRTIYGRPDKPMVVVEIRPLSAAAAAGAAHETLRTSLVNQSQPAPLGR
jgi:hypothetical protein